MRGLGSSLKGEEAVLTMGVTGESVFKTVTADSLIATSCSPRNTTKIRVSNCSREMED